MAVCLASARRRCAASPLAAVRPAILQTRQAPSRSSEAPRRDPAVFLWLKCKDILELKEKV